MICKVRSLKSRMNTHPSLEETINLSNVVFKEFESDMAVGIRKLCNLTRKTAELMIQQRTLRVLKYWLYRYKGKISDLWDIACIFVMLYTRTHWKDWPRKIQFSNNAMQFIAVELTDPAQKLLKLHGRSIVGGGCSIITSIVASKGSW